MGYQKKSNKKLLKQIQAAFAFEEKLVMEFLYDCYERLPGYLNEKELEQVRRILGLIVVQSLGHAAIDSDLIVKLYEKTSK